MKKLIMIAIVATSMMAAHGCKKAGETTTTGDQPAESTKALSVDVEKSANTIAAAICKRMAACAKESGAEEVDETKCTNDIAAGLAHSLPEKTTNLTDEMVSACADGIGAASCEEMSSDKAPKGCEFMN